MISHSEEFEELEKMLDITPEEYAKKHTASLDPFNHRKHRYLGQTTDVVDPNTGVYTVLPVKIGKCFINILAQDDTRVRNSYLNFNKETETFEKAVDEAFDIEKEK